jgi:glycosyltransferase involved in cell wall biosynthesis
MTEATARSLRTIHIATSLDRDQGGPPVSVFNYTACSLHAGIFAEVATTYDPKLLESSTKSQIEATGGHVYTFPRSGPSPWYRKRWGISFALLRWILKEAKGYDIVVVHGGWSFSSVAGLLAAKLADRPCVLVPHASLTNYDVRRRGSIARIFFKVILRRLYWRYCAVLIFSSRLERDDSVPKKARARQAVLPHPIFDDRDAIRAVQPGIKSGLHRIGFIGRLHPVKNLDLLISSLVRLPNSICLTIAGDGPETIKSGLQALAETSGVEHRIEWIGFVEGKSKTEFFKRVDVLAMPSEYESFGLAAAEAMVRGVPAVVTSRSGIAEVISEFGGGRVCDPNSEDLADQLRALHDDPDLVSRLSQQAVDTATKRLSFSAFGSALKELYQTLNLRREVTPHRVE